MELERRSLLFNLMLADLRVDPLRVYVAGYSNGACSRSRPPAGCPGESRPPVQWAGRSPIRLRNGSDGPVRGPTVLDHWRQAGGCGGPVAQSTDVATIESRALGCPAGVEVAEMGLLGAGHSWPERPGAPPGPEQALDANSVLWSFFATHSLN